MNLLWYLHYFDAIYAVLLTVYTLIVFDFRANIRVMADKRNPPYTYFMFCNISSTNHLRQIKSHALFYKTSPAFRAPYDRDLPEKPCHKVIVTHYQTRSLSRTVAPGSAG
jgi:hypothetical protein